MIFLLRLKQVVVTYFSLSTRNLWRIQITQVKISLDTPCRLWQLSRPSARLFSRSRWLSFQQMASIELWNKSWRTEWSILRQFLLPHTCPFAREGWRFFVDLYTSEGWYPENTRIMHSLVPLPAKKITDPDKNVLCIQMQQILILTFTPKQPT